MLNRFTDFQCINHTLGTFLHHPI
uniref:Uncharacterized protein n=1 Tax=Anguilla anguilla TaxID=7936 RepID=A0A0E9SXC1_ANGAN